MSLLLCREDAGNSFIAQGVTQGWGAVEEQLKELCGMSVSCCIPKFSARSYRRVYLHNWLSCFSPTHIHPLTDSSCLLSGPCSRTACWKTVCLGFSVAGDNDIRQHFPVLSEAAALRGFLWPCSLSTGSRTVRAPSIAVCRGWALPQRPPPSSTGACRPSTELIFLMTSHAHVFLSSSSMPMIL